MEKSGLKFVRAALAALMGMMLAGCGAGSASAEDTALSAGMARVELTGDTQPDGFAAAVGEEVTALSTYTDETSWLPSFGYSDGTESEAMEELNDTVQEISDAYQEALSDDGTYSVIYAEDGSTGPYMAATIYETSWKETLTGGLKCEKNLTTLAYDQDTDTAITSVEALESTGMTGVELSQEVESLYGQDNDASLLHSTEMQGFALDADGKVTEIYMKLEVEDGTSEDGTKILFYLFDPDKESLTPLAF